VNRDSGTDSTNGGWNSCSVVFHEFKTAPDAKSYQAGFSFPRARNRPANYFSEKRISCLHRNGNRR
jgi:hypothetical protein